MFQYEYEKRPPSSNSCDSRATMTTEWSRVYPSGAGSGRSANSGRTRLGQGQASSEVRLAHARRPLPPRPILCDRIPSKTTVPLKVWVVAGASCFAVCAVLVLATVVVTRWGAGEASFAPPQYADAPAPIYSNPKAKSFRLPSTTTEEANTLTTSDELEDDLELPIIEKLAIFKNLVANREKNRNNENRRPELSLMSKPQMHPLHDTSIHHEERRIEKKDQAKHPDVVPIDEEIDSIDIKKPIPEFKPTLPDVFINRHNEIKLPDGYVAGLRKHDDDFYEEYYNDENLYDDYMQSNTMTNYLIEKVQELHDWITTDPDFELHNPNNGTSKRNGTGNEFKQLLQALNTSLVEGNVSVVMNKLRDIYFGDFNQSSGNHSRKIIVTNGTDLLSFGILTLDVMLLHNIQLMAWESQESSRARMLKDPDVFAFNALFMDPTKVEAKQNDINHYNEKSSKRQNLRQDMDAFDLGKNLLESILEVGLSSARAAIHLGRVYKNTKNVLNQLSNRESLNANIQNQISRNIEGNSHALNHLQSSFNKSDSLGVNVANGAPGFYTDLDCVWMLYCKNLVATAKLNAPYGTMARINGMALRMLSGDISADRALDTMLYEAFSGWTELKCNDMFPRCSKVSAASVVMDSILQPLRRSQSNRTR